MKLLKIQDIPNQVFTTTIGEDNYRIAIRTIQGLSFMSVWKNDIVLFYNQVCVPNEFVNPYNYLSESGKFYFESLDGEYPNYKQFNVTQFLYFLSADEVEEYEKA